MIPVPPERPPQPYEVPYRQVEHQPGDEDPWTPEESFPGPVGHATIDMYGYTPTKAQRDKWRKEVEELERRRIPLGFRAAG